MANIQWEKFQQSAADKGWTIRTADHIDATNRLVLIYRMDKSPVLAIVRLFGEDGYSLYLATEGNTIESDIEAVESAN